jgi:hypothetical protein
MLAALLFLALRLRPFFRLVRGDVLVHLVKHEAQRVNVIAFQFIHGRSVEDDCVTRDGRDAGPVH